MRVLYKRNQPVPAGFLQGELKSTLQKWSQCTLWVSAGHFGPETTMYPQCTYWVIGGLPPVWRIRDSSSCFWDRELLSCRDCLQRRPTHPLVSYLPFWMASWCPVPFSFLRPPLRLTIQIPKEFWPSEWTIFCLFQVFLRVFEFSLRFFFLPLSSFLLQDVFHFIWLFLLFLGLLSRSLLHLRDFHFILKILIISLNSLFFFWVSSFLWFTSSSFYSHCFPSAPPLPASHTSE